MLNNLELSFIILTFVLSIYGRADTSQRYLERRLQPTYINFFHYKPPQPTKVTNFFH
jgi:hypothetical protein